MARVQKGRNHIAELKDKAGHLHAVTDAFVPPVIDNLAHTLLPCLSILQPDYCDPAQNRHTGNCRCSTESPGNPQYQPQQYPSNPQYHPQQYPGNPQYQPQQYPSNPQYPYSGNPQYHPQPYPVNPQYHYPAYPQYPYPGNYQGHNSGKQANNQGTQNDPNITFN